MTTPAKSSLQAWVVVALLCVVGCDPRYRATGYGVLNFLSCTIGGIGIYAGGALRDANVDLGKLFLFVSFAIAACAVLLFFLKPKQNSVTSA
ncbi:MAG: hypothetical protein V4773_07785 [Verrucomicrobiota bacterium]